MEPSTRNFATETAFNVKSSGMNVKQKEFVPGWDEFREKLIEASKTETQEALARRLKTTRGTINKWMSGVGGGQKTPAHKMIFYLREMGIDPSKYYSDIGLNKVFENSPEYGSTGIEIEEYSFVKKVEARPSAGGGSLQNSGQEVMRLAFRTDWLTSKTTSNPQQLVLMEVHGDSMHPTLEDGDTVLVDQGNDAKKLIDGKVYVIGYGNDGDVFIKRFRSAPGRLLFMGDNQDESYRNITILQGQDQPDRFKVFGKVIWAAKEM